MSRRFRWEWPLESGEKQKDYSAVALLTYTLLLAVVQLRNRRIRKQHIEVKKKVSRPKADDFFPLQTETHLELGRRKVPKVDGVLGVRD
jgi:hypothetical protein